MDTFWLFLFLIGLAYWAFRRGKRIGSIRGFHAGCRKNRRNRSRR